MVIWIDRNELDDRAIGFDQDVLRRDEVFKVLDIDSTLTEARNDAAAMIAAAHVLAESITLDANSQAETLLSEAKEKYDNSGRLGYAAGLRRGTEDIHDTMQQRVRSERESARLSEQRLVRVVMKAVEQVVLETDRAALLARVGVTLARVIDGESYVSLTVHPEDQMQARLMLEKIAAEAGWEGGFDVLVDASAGVGSCLCEWDYGVLDAGLNAQFAALRRALLNTSQDTDASPSSGAAWPEESADEAPTTPYFEPTS